MSKQPKMDWAGIKAAIHRQGMTLTELAIRNGLPAGACRKLQTVKHYPAQEIVAKFLGFAQRRPVAGPLPEGWSPDP